MEVLERAARMYFLLFLRFWSAGLFWVFLYQLSCLNSRKKKNEEKDLRFWKMELKVRGRRGARTHHIHGSTSLLSRIISQYNHSTSNCGSGGTGSFGRRFLKNVGQREALWRSLWKEWKKW